MLKRFLFLVAVLAITVAILAGIEAFAGATIIGPLLRLTNYAGTGSAPAAAAANTGAVVYDTTAAFPAYSTGSAWSMLVPTIADEGTGLTKRSTVNFIGSGVSCADNAGSTRTDCTLSAGSSTESFGGNSEYTGINPIANYRAFGAKTTAYLFLTYIQNGGGAGNAVFQIYNVTTATILVTITQDCDTVAVGATAEATAAVTVSASDQLQIRLGPTTNCATAYPYVNANARLN